MNTIEIDRMLNEPGARLDGRLLRQSLWVLSWQEPITKQCGRIISTSSLHDYLAAVSEVLRLKRQHRKQVRRVAQNQRRKVG